MHVDDDEKLELLILSRLLPQFYSEIVFHLGQLCLKLVLAELIKLQQGYLKPFQVHLSKLLNFKILTLRLVEG